MKKVKVYSAVVYFTDHDELGAKEFKKELEAARVAGRHLTVGDIETRSIGQWDDDHPLNQTKGLIGRFSKFFSTENPSKSKT